MTLGINRFPLPALNEQANAVEKYGLETLLFCPDPWALRHVFIDQKTRETVRVRCNRWDCLYCGSHKVDQWRQLVQAAEPTLFIKLMKAGKTVEEAGQCLMFALTLKCADFAVSTVEQPGFSFKGFLPGVDV